MNGDFNGAPFVAARRGRAFTLVEILIVVIVLGILAAVVVPQFSDASQDSSAATLRSSLRTIQSRLDAEFQLGGTGTYPAAVDVSWFAGGLLPKHPGNSFGVAAIEVVSSAGTTHPVNKVLQAGVGGAYWYNSAEGIVRALVTDQGSAPATLDFYNLVNDSSEAALGNYGGGGGS